MGRIVPSGGLPADVGVVVDNISTVKAISDAIQTGMPLVERVATVTGEKIKNPGLRYQDRYKRKRADRLLRRIYR